MVSAVFDNKSVTKLKDGVASLGMGIIIYYRSLKIRFAGKKEACSYKKRKAVKTIIKKKVDLRNRAKEIINRKFLEMQQEIISINNQIAFN